MNSPIQQTVGVGLLASRPGLDQIFIGVPLVFALGLGAVASMSPTALVAIVLIDVWLLANPHLVATYTRMVIRTADIQQNWFLICCLPALVLAGVVVTALSYEVAGLFTLYFVTQTYHVARQSFGISRAYLRAQPNPPPPDRLAEGLIYLFPAWGLLARCADMPQAFLGYPIHLPVVAAPVVGILGVAAFSSILWWLQRQWGAVLAGNGNWRHDGFVASHLLVSFVAYVWTTDITTGWVVINIWHNLQYLLFVWVQNIRRDSPMQGDSSLLIGVSELWRKAARYSGLCLVFGAALYQAAQWAGTQLLWLGLPTVLIAHFTLNFHHYLVDGVIWRRRRPWLIRWLSPSGAPVPQQLMKSDD